MAKLFESFTIGNVELKNRIVMAPMCMYRATNDGFLTDFHRIHYPTRAIGRVGLIILEATAVTPEGRITDSDLGIWIDEHVEGLREIVRLVHQYGSKVGIQLAHAGRKSSVPDIIPIAPSPIAFGDLKEPKQMDDSDISRITDAFEAGAARAVDAGFDLIEIHSAHGFLLNEFLSPITNKRSDAYGGDLGQRVGLLKEVVEAVKKAVDMPLLVRLSATDWVEGGITVDDTVRIARELKNEGISLIDVSSGGISPDVNIFKIQEAGFNGEFSEKIRREAGIATAVAGLITDAHQAEEILRDNKADLISLGRELLRNPNFPVDAQIKLGVQDIDIDPIYKRAYPVE